MQNTMVLVERVRYNEESNAKSQPIVKANQRSGFLCLGLLRKYETREALHEFSWVKKQINFQYNFIMRPSKG